MAARRTFSALVLTRLELRIFFRSQGVRWPLRPSDDVEVWDGDALLGYVTGDTLASLLKHHMLTALMQANISRQMAQPRRHDPLPPEVYAPAHLPPQLALGRRDALRARRRSRKKA